MSVSACSCVANRRSRMPVRSTIHSSVVSTTASRVLVREHAVGHVHAEAGDPDPRAVGGADHELVHRERQRAAHGELAVDGRARLAAADRAADRLELAFERQLVARLDDPLEAARRRCRRRARSCRGSPPRRARRPRRPAPAPRPSCTPGMIGLPGKWPAQSSSVTSLRGDDAHARLQLEHLVEQEERIAVRQDLPRSPPCRAGRAVHAESQLPQPVAAAVGVALGRADGHPLGARDLLEAEVERVLEHDHPRLRRRDLGQTRTELRAELGQPRRPGRVPVARLARVLVERLAAPRQLPLGDVAARVDRQPVQPGRERRLAAELAAASTHSFASASCAASRASSGSRSRCRASSLHPRRVPLAERVERARVAVLCSLHQDRIAEPLVVERRVGPQVLPDWTRPAQRAVASRRVYWHGGSAPEAGLLTFPAASHATARTMPSRGAFGTRASPAATPHAPGCARRTAASRRDRLADPDPERRISARSEPRLRACRARTAAASVERPNVSVASTTAS